MIDTVVNPLPFGGFCGKIHKNCGHECKGIAKERKCLPCIDPVCTEGANAMELCGICYTSDLGDEPCSKLGCGHVFHTNCIVELLKHGHATTRLSFAFMSCPACKAPIDVF
jgi:E3 ubiquitin-protein ligase MYCBP2